jgi:Fe-S-cluster containining protein
VQTNSLTGVRIFRRFLVSACLSVLPSVCISACLDTRLILDGFSWNLILRTFTKISWAIKNLVKVIQECRACCKKPECVKLWATTYLVQEDRQRSAALHDYAFNVYYIVYMYVNKTNDADGCVSIVTVVTRTRHYVTLCAHCLPCYFYYLCSVLFIFNCVAASLIEVKTGDSSVCSQFF